MVIPRGWKDADAVAAVKNFFGWRPPRAAAIRALMADLISDDRYTRRCSADLARRISEQQPGILQRYADVLVDLAGEIGFDEWQARGYLVLAASRNATSGHHRQRLLPIVRALMEDERNALRAIGLEAFALIAEEEPELREEAVVLLESARREGTPAMRARARRMLLALMAPAKTGRPVSPALRRIQGSTVRGM
jgi:hypothetical protein